LWNALGALFGGSNPCVQRAPLVIIGEPDVFNPQQQADQKREIVTWKGKQYYPAPLPSTAPKKRKTRKQRGGVQNLPFYEELKRVDPIFYLAYEVASVKLFNIAITQKTSNVLSDLVVN
jgi:hypothetical protein